MNTVAYFVILTLAKPIPNGQQQGTYRATIQVGPDGTRAEILDWMLQQVPEQMRDGTILFFSAEPNEITPYGSGAPNGSATQALAGGAQ